MKTATFFLQDADQTPILKPLIAQAIARGFTRFLTAMPLTDDWGLAFTIEAASLEDFPLDNLLAAERVLLVYEPLRWLCEQSEEAIAVWDGSDGETLHCLGYLKAWGLPGTYVNPSRTFQCEKL
jgi:hypothetical protein